jgi:hypothetical protein
MIKILYGTAPHFIDITHYAIRQHMRNNIIFIPKGDEHRAYLFSDPYPRVVKMITFIDERGVETVVGPDDDVYIDIVTQQVYTTDIPQYVKDIYPS